MAGRRLAGTPLLTLALVRSPLFCYTDFTQLGLPMQPDANLDISSYETLAQCFVLLAFWKSHGSGRLAHTLPALSDNSGAEWACNKLYTSSQKNEDADLLSRWDGTSDLPAQSSCA